MKHNYAYSGAMALEYKRLCKTWAQHRVRPVNSCYLKVRAIAYRKVPYVRPSRKAHLRKLAKYNLRAWSGLV